MFEILEDRTALKVIGLDTQKFLQSITTNDIINNEFSYNYLLNSRGKYLFDFFVFKENEITYWIDLQKTKRIDFIRRLNLYKLRSNFEVLDMSKQYVISYSMERIDSSICSYQDPRYKLLRYRSILKQQDTDIFRDKAKNLYIKDKYEYCIPDGDIDLLYEKSIPVEYGAEELNAIDYKKGCYIGQEVISRAKYQGIVRKKIYKILSGTELAPYNHGAELTDQYGNVIGIFCSFYKNQGIVLLREEKYLGLEKKVAIIQNNEVKILLPKWRLINRLLKINI